MIIIGEKINATRKSIGRALVDRDGEFLLSLARSQVDAGADYIDINVGSGLSPENERNDIEWLTGLIQEKIDKPLAFDSPDPAVIEAGLRRNRSTGGGRAGSPIINSITAEPHKLNALLPLAKEYDADLIALAMGPEGIPGDVRGRLKACETIAEHASDHGIDMPRIYFDPLALPLSVDNSNGRIAMETLKEIKRRLPDARTTIGLSNISYGLPDRALINRVFLMLLLPIGLDSALLDPLDRHMMSCVRAAHSILQEDPYCREFLRAYRKGLLDLG